jgi:ABC-type Mn2+/Zn2+ transport system permease subunit
MFLFALAFGVFACVVGLFGSYTLNTASGPTIVLVCIAIFIASLIKTG